MDIQKKIKSLVRKYKTKCPYQLAKSLNVHVRFVDMPEGVRGFYYRTLKQKFIGLNTKYSSEQQRFTCSHEIGHHVLDGGVGYYFLEDHTLFNPGKFERNANLFAVSLLTYESEIMEDETIEHYYMRNGIPREIIGKV